MEWKKKFRSIVIKKVFMTIEGQVYNLPTLVSDFQSIIMSPTDKCPFKNTFFDPKYEHS